MNKVILIGRLTKDPEVRTGGQTDVVRYVLAVDRQGQTKEADFISCVTFGHGAEFAQKYLQKGMKIAVDGHIRTGSYDNKEGRKVYTTDVVVENHEFCEPKKQTEGWEQVDPAEPPFV